MKKKGVLLVFIVSIILLSGVGLSAQSAFSTFSFDIGFAPHYTFDTNTYRTDSSYAFNVKVSNPLTVGFGIIGLAAPNDTTLLRVKYDVASQIRLMTAIGTDGADMVNGFGFEFIPLTQRGALTSEFKLAIEYLFQPGLAGGVGNGSLYFGIVLGLGI